MPGNVKKWKKSFDSSRTAGQQLFVARHFYFAKQSVQYGYRLLHTTGCALPRFNDIAGGQYANGAHF
jgi:hypothetical protein